MSAPGPASRPSLTVFRLLRRTSPLVLGAAALASLASGGLTIALIASANRALRHLGEPGAAARYVALCLVLYACEIFARLSLIRIGQRALFELRLDLVRRVLHAPFRQLEQIGSARVFAAVSSGVFDILVAIQNTPGLIAQSLVVVGCLAYCFVLLPVGGAVMLVVLVATVFASRRVHKRGLRLLFGLHDTEQQLFGYVKALVDGAKELKLHGPRREAFERLFEETALALRRGQIRATSILQLSVGWAAVMSFALIGAVVFALPRLRPEADAATLGGFVLAFIYISSALGFVLQILNNVGVANVALGRIQALGLEVADEGAAAAPPLPADWRRIQLDGVTHAYRRDGEDSVFQLGPIDLTIERGETLFVVGGNGSGKSTLGKLLAGLYLPEEGQVRVDGEPVSAAARPSYRGLFSAVFSDFYLFDRLLGLVAPDRDTLARAYIDKLKLRGKLTIADGVLSTTELSQGQRKRLALLTAWLEDRPIYLFDEWAADQDPEFKEVFYRELLPELKRAGKTVIAITHDDRYFGLADRIVKLANGAIVSSEGGAGQAASGG